jgi:hypothetical protein
LIFVKVMERGDEENQHRHFAAPVSADPRLTPWDRIMLITICRLYVTMLALPGVGAVVDAGWLAALLGSMAIGGATGGLLGALTNAGISEEDAHVFVEGVRRGGTLVAARVSPTDVPRVEAMMNQSAVKLGERCDLYRKSGWQAFDPSAVPYTADQVRSERALHAH